MTTPARPRARAILDTNVFLSGIFFGGVPGRILDAWQAGHLALVLSPAELAVRYPQAAALLHPLLAIVAQSATMVNAPELLEPVSADPDDDKFLARAVASRTHVIVSGDKHLLRVSGWNRIEVLTPRQMADRYKLDR